MNKETMKDFTVEVEKLAFGFSAHQEQNQPQKKTLGQSWGAVVRHPVGFVSSVVKGEAAGLAGGAIGGAMVAAPVAALMAHKDPGKDVTAIGKGIFGGIGKKMPTFAGRFAHHEYELGKGETIGGGVIGMGLGANKFFNKYKNENNNVQNS